MKVHENCRKYGEYWSTSGAKCCCVGKGVYIERHCTADRSDPKGMFPFVNFCANGTFQNETCHHNTACKSCEDHCSLQPRGTYEVEHCDSKVGPRCICKVGYKIKENGTCVKVDNTSMDHFTGSNLPLAVVLVIVGILIIIISSSMPKAYKHLRGKCKADLRCAEDGVGEKPPLPPTAADSDYQTDIDTFMGHFTKLHDKDQAAVLDDIIDKVSASIGAWSKPFSRHLLTLVSAECRAVDEILLPARVDTIILTAEAQSRDDVQEFTTLIMNRAREMCATSEVCVQHTLRALLLTHPPLLHNIITLLTNRVLQPTAL